MNRDEFESQLADYLGGEMNADERGRFENYLQQNPAAHAEARELSAALDALGGLPAASQVEAAMAVCNLSVIRRWRIQRFAVAALKAAAVLAIGVVLGRMTAGEPAKQPVREIVYVTTTSEPLGPDGTHPGWIDLARTSARSSSSMVTGLMYLANAGRS
jgi:anti-sigma factor RsiW